MMDEQRMRKADQLSRDALHIRQAMGKMQELCGMNMRTPLYRSLHDLRQRMDNESVAVRLAALEAADDA